jgi:hypothetical protein
MSDDPEFESILNQEELNSAGYEGSKMSGLRQRFRTLCNGTKEDWEGS